MPRIPAIVIRFRIGELSETQIPVGAPSPELKSFQSALTKSDPPVLIDPYIRYPQYFLGAHSLIHLLAPPSLIDCRAFLVYNILISFLS